MAATSPRTQQLGNPEFSHALRPATRSGLRPVLPSSPGLPASAPSRAASETDSDTAPRKTGPAAPGSSILGSITQCVRRAPCAQSGGPLQKRVPLVLAVHGAGTVAVAAVVGAIEVQPGVLLLFVDGGPPGSARGHSRSPREASRGGVAQPRELQQLQKPARKAHELTGRESVVLVRQPRGEDGALKSAEHAATRSCIAASPARTPVTSSW